MVGKILSLRDKMAGVSASLLYRDSQPYANSYLPSTNPIRLFKGTPVLSWGPSWKPMGLRNSYNWTYTLTYTWVSLYKASKGNYGEGCKPSYK